VTISAIITPMTYDPEPGPGSRRMKESTNMRTLKPIELFDEPYSGRLRVHEANAEVVIEIGGVSIPVTWMKWKSRKLSGRRRYTLTLPGRCRRAGVLHPADGPGRHGAGSGGPGEGPGADRRRALAVLGQPPAQVTAGDAGDAGDVPTPVRQSSELLQGMGGAGNDRWNITCMTSITCTSATASASRSNEGSGRVACQAHSRRPADEPRR